MPTNSPRNADVVIKVNPEFGESDSAEEEEWEIGPRKSKAQELKVAAKKDDDDWVGSSGGEEYNDDPDIRISGDSVLVGPSDQSAPGRYSRSSLRSGRSGVLSQSADSLSVHKVSKQS